MDNGWTKVFDHKNRCVGHMRQNRNGRWVVKSDARTKSFNDWFDAQQWLMTARRGVKWQVKTLASHQYWTGSAWSDDRLDGKVFTRKGDAQACAASFRASSWDRVCVVPFRQDNWAGADDGMPSCLRIPK